MNSRVISLKRLLRDAQFINCDDLAISDVTAHSSRITAGDTFVAIPGPRLDGHNFVPDAIARGARSLVVCRPFPEISIPQCVVPCTATAHAHLAMALAHGQSEEITTAGITGTNGKTTTSWLLASILRSAGLQTGLIGTIENSDGHTSYPSSMTTPGTEEIAALFRSMRQQRTSHCAMEISSHALVQKRCAAVPLSAAAITNVTQDHLDYHIDLESYRTAKAEIADLLHPDAPLLLNADDAGCRTLYSGLASQVRVVTFGTGTNDAELTADTISKNHRSQRIQLHLAQGTANVRLRLIGEHNVFNSLAAAGLAEQLGVRLSAIVEGLESVAAVPGRMERISEGQPFQVLVDYAHTADALTHSIATLRATAPGRLICVFGAGGNRDTSKRPHMGAAASAADIAILTTDNPRGERPERIIDEIADGVSPDTPCLKEPDRRYAIARAFTMAEPGDAVLVAGKGHECRQEMSPGCYTPFDDRAECRQLLQESAAGNCVSRIAPLFSLPRSA